MIASARLELEVIHGKGEFALHRVLQPWSDTYTWSAAGEGVQADGQEASVLPEAITDPARTGALVLDVTASLQAWAANPATNFGWVILPRDDGQIVFHSAEGAAPPVLVVQFTSAGRRGPELQIESVTPDPRVQDVDQIVLRFSAPVAGFDLSDVQLTRHDGISLLPGPATLTTTDGVTWTLGSLGELTDQPGQYQLVVVSAGSGIVDELGRGLAQDEQVRWADVRQAGDANLDRTFDQLDIVQILQGDKYRAGGPTHWGEGDWNGDDLFDPLDIVLALQAAGYLKGPYG